jgi:hypothetical protein
LSKLTKEEKAWVQKVQRLLSNPPSDRLGFYTTGDNNVTIYNKDLESEIDALYDKGGREFCSSVDDADAELGELIFPNQVHSTAG